MNIQKKKNAFTLVELIIVITILGILATIAFVSFQWYTKDSRDSNRLANINNFQKSLEIYKTKVWIYPVPENITSTWQVDWLDLIYVGSIWDTISRQLSLSKTPVDPLLNDNYIYGTDTNYLTYQISTILENYNANIIIPTTYAYWYKAKVVWNYTWLLKKSSKVYNIPSIIFTWSGDLTSNQTYFVIDKGENLPYKVSWNDSGNLNSTQILKSITSKDNLTITGVLISDWDSNSWSLSQTLGYDIDEVWIAYYGEKKYISDIKVTWDSTINTPEVYNCIWSLVTAHADIINNTWLQVNTNYQNTNISNSCYYTCKSWFWWNNCEIVIPTCNYGEDGTTWVCRDPYWNNVITLNHFDGNLNDEKWSTFSHNGNSSIVSNSYKFWNWSVAFDGNGDYINGTTNSTDAFWDWDYTVELWIKLNTTNQASFFESTNIWWLWSRQGSFIFRYNWDQFHLFSMWSDEVFNASLNSYIWEWIHVAIARSSGTTKLFLNGNVVWTSTKYYNDSIWAKNIWTFCDSTGLSPNWNFDEYRITKWVARYTSNFTPPIQAFPNQ